MPKKDDWYKFCRPHLEWLNWEINLDTESYVSELIDRAKQLNSDTLAYPFESGGLLLYPGKLAPMDNHIGGRDLLGMIEREAHKAGLKFVICFLGMSANTYITNTHNDWIVRDKDGKLVEPWHGYHFRSLCPNSPYGNYLAEVLSDLLSRYDVDGIYVEGIHTVDCYCSYCQDRFKRMYGRDLPRDNARQSKEYNEFRLETVTDVYRKMRGVIQDISPETVFFGCAYYPHSSNVRSISQYADVVTMECQWGYAGMDPKSTSLPEVGLIVRMLNAEGKKPALATQWIAKHVDYNYSPRSALHVKLAFLEILFNGAIVQLHTQNALEIDDSLLPTLTELYTDVEKLRPYLVDSRFLAYAAILDWADPRDFDSYFDDSLRGAYKALLEHHIPCDIVTAEDIESGALENYKVLVLPNARELSDPVIERIADYVRGGGSLVMTYQSGLHDENGNRRTETLLDDLAGLKRHFTGSGLAPDRFPPQVYYRITGHEEIWGNLEGRLLSFRGLNDNISGYEEVECRDDDEIMGYILDFDYSRMHTEHIGMGAYPGRAINPMIVARQVGEGRVVYISGELCAAARRYGDPHSIDVLARSVRWAGRDELSIRSNCPPSVEIIPHVNQRGISIMLLNATTNQLSADPVRYVVPISDVELHVKLDGAEPQSISSLTGQELTTEVKDGWLLVKLEKLAEYEAVMIDTGNSLSRLS